LLLRKGIKQPEDGGNNGLNDKNDRDGVGGGEMETTETEAK
jgi:hypothetical protein